MTSEREHVLQVELVDNEGYYRKASYDFFRMGPGPDYLLHAANFSSDDNWFVRDAFAESDSQSFVATDSGSAYQNCVNTLNGGTGW